MKAIKPVKIEENLIKNVVQRIKEKFAPQKIILFGSRAWGNPSVDSDLDLFVVMPSRLRRDDRSLEVSNLFYDRMFPMDVIVYTPEEVELSLKRNNPFIKEILEKGKTLYGR